MKKKRGVTLINVSSFYYGVPDPLPVVQGLTIIAAPDAWLFARDAAGHVFFLGENRRKTAWVLTPKRASDGAALTDRRIHIPKP